VILSPVGTKIPNTNDTAKLYGVLKKHAPEGTYGVLGAVFERDAQLTFVGLALASKQKVRVNLCAVEGGNMLLDYASFEKMWANKSLAGVPGFGDKYARIAFDIAVK